MPTDFEQLVRASLEARAQDVQPDPGTWERVQARIRRRERLRWALAGVAVAALAAVATVAVPAVLEQRRIDLGPATPTSERAVAPEANGELRVHATPCGAVGDIAIVFVRSAQLWALCTDGQRASLDVSGAAVTGAAHPTVAADGSRVVFERAADGASQLVSLDLRTGAEQVLGAGTRPVFGPKDEALAWVEDDSADEAPPRVVVSHDGTVDEHVRVPGDAGTQVEALAWDASGDWVVVVTRRRGAPDATGEVHAIRLRDGETLVAAPVRPQVDYVAATGSDQPSTSVVVQRCCIATLRTAQLVRASWNGEQPRGEVIAALPDLDVDGDGLYVAAAGQLWAQADGALVADAHEAWLVGDGDALFVLRADRSTRHILDGVQAAAFNPAVRLHPDSGGT